MVTPGSPGVGGIHRCRRALRPCALREPCLVEMLQQPHVAERVQRHAAGEHQPMRAGLAQQVIDDVDHRVFEHELRRCGLVEAILRVRPMLDVLDAQHGVGIPQLVGLERFAENVDQRLLVGMRRTGRNTSCPWRG